MTGWAEPLQAVGDAILCADWVQAAKAASRVRSVPGYDASTDCMAVLTELAARLPRGPYASVRRRGSWRGHDGVVTCVQFLADDRQALTSGEDGAIRLWDVESGTCLGELCRQEAAIMAVRVSKDGSRLVSLDGQGLVAEWDLRTGASTRVHKTPAWLLDVTSPGDVMVWGGPIGVTVVQVGSGRHLRTLQASCGALALSPDGRRTATATTDGVVQVWSVASGAHHNSSAAPIGRVRALTFSGDGRQVLTGGDDATVRCFDAVSLDMVTVMSGHQVPVWSIAASADGKMAVSGAGDSRVCVWDLRLGACVEAVEGNVGWGHALSVARLGHRFLAGSADGFLQLWQLDWQVQAIDEPDSVRTCLELFLDQHPCPEHDWDSRYFDMALADLRHRGYGSWSTARIAEQLRDIARTRRRPT